MSNSASCFVYVMAAGKFIKVGIAADVDRRLGNVRSGALEVEVICKRRMPNRATALKAEKAIHSALAKHHHRREWFIVKPARAKAVLSRHCARVRLEAAIEARKPLEGMIKLSEVLEDVRITYNFHEAAAERRGTALSRRRLCL